MTGSGADGLLRSSRNVGTCRKQEGEPDATYYFYDAQLQLVERRNMPDYRFDPRERVWYQNALESTSTVFSDPYVFFTTREVGVSLSVQAANGQSAIGMDITLDDLGEGLADLRMSPGTEIALVDWRGAVVAYSDMATLRASSSHPELIAHVLGPLESLPMEALSTLRNIGQDGVPVSYESGGRTWWSVVTRATSGAST